MCTYSGVMCTYSGVMCTYLGVMSTYSGVQEGGKPHGDCTLTAAEDLADPNEFLLQLLREASALTGPTKLLYALHLKLISSCRQIICNAELQLGLSTPSSCDLLLNEQVPR